MPKKMHLRQVDTKAFAIVLLVAAAVSVFLLFTNEYARNNSRALVRGTGGVLTVDDMEEPVNFQTVFIKGGCFQASVGDRAGDEADLVCVDDYYMLRHEITAGEFGEFVRATGYRTDAESGNGCYRGEAATAPDKSLSWRDPGFPQSDNHPAVCVSWNDAIRYVQWKSRVEGRTYRLPTEAEWEFAARSGGLINRWAGTNLESDLDYYAWYEKIAEGMSHPVGQKRANGIGLYDMSGNVREWVSDRLQAEFSLKNPDYDALRPGSEELRITRGGSWSNDRQGVEIANRSRRPLSESSTDLGFRIAYGPLRKGVDRAMPSPQ